MTVAMSALALLLIACGGGESSDSANRVAIESQTADGADAQVDAEGSAEAMDISAMTDGDCLKIGNSLTGIFSRGAVGDFDEDLATFRSFASNAPDESRSQIDTFLDAYQEAVRVLDDAGISLTDVEAMQAEDAAETVNAASALVETPEVEAGVQAAEDFLFQTCPVLQG